MSNSLDNVFQGIYKSIVEAQNTIDQQYIGEIKEDYFDKEGLNNSKILGVHFRGTSYKTSRGHIFPTTVKQITKHLDNLLN